MFFFKKPFVQPSNTFVFICGLHRSGTSLLHTLLREHPDVSGFSNTGAPEDEGQYLQTVYPTIRESGGAGKFCFDNKARMDEHSVLVTDKSRRKLLEQWGAYWDMKKPVLVEKSPPNIIRSRFLQALFPNSCFIFLTRHPVVVSYATQKWSETTIPELFTHWTKAHRIMREDTPSLKRHLHLHYEQLIMDPDGTMAKVQHFIGINQRKVGTPVYKVLNDSYYDRFAAMKASTPAFANECKKFEENFKNSGYLLDPPYVSL